MKHKLLENLIIFVSVSVAFVAGAFMVLKAPQFHSDYIRGITEPNVLLMQEKENGSPIGTGFVLKHKGENIVLTNAHICRNIEGTTVALNDKGVEISLQLVKIDKHVDLCKLEILDDMAKSFEGLELSEASDLGQELMVTGHPRVLPFTLSRGQVIGLEEVAIPHHRIVSQAGYDECHADPYSRPMNTMMGWLCFQVYDGLYTTILGMPGNSGSPIVNFHGEVVSVVFAANEYGWMIGVPNKHIKNFLED